MRYITVDTLPEQHIDSLPKPKRDEAHQLVGMICAFRSMGLSESEVADKTRFGSVEDMYFRLKRWGLPGLVPLEEKSKSVRERKARTVKSELEELPAVENAAVSFRDTIRTLEVFFEHTIGLNTKLENLDYENGLKETLQGGRFVGEGEAQEENICEARGAQWHPHPYLVILIATSILEHQGNWGHVERLLQELHPRPTEANKQQLVRLIYGKKVDERGRPELKSNGHPVDYGDGLLDRANQIAALVRGKPKIGRGAKEPAITSFEQLSAWDIQSLVEKGLSREEIEKREREDFDRWTLETKQSVMEELELDKQVLDENEFARVSRDAHDFLQQYVEKTFDKDEFDRIWGLRALYQNTRKDE